MNKHKWLDPNVPMITLAAKLAEECGETVSEILDADEDGYVMEGSLKRMEEEATHAEFLASVIRSRAQGMRFRLMSEMKSQKKKKV